MTPLAYPASDRLSLPGARLLTAVALSLRCSVHRTGRDLPDDVRLSTRRDTTKYVLADLYHGTGQLHPLFGDIRVGHDGAGEIELARLLVARVDDRSPIRPLRLGDRCRLERQIFVTFLRRLDGRCRFRRRRWLRVVEALLHGTHRALHRALHEHAEHLIDHPLELRGGARRSGGGSRSTCTHGRGRSCGSYGSSRGR